VLARRYGFDLAAVVSASHNPYHDNGIKFFSGDGMKLTDEAEAEIEARLEDGGAARVGRVHHLEGALDDYVRELARAARDGELVRVDDAARTIESEQDRNVGNAERRQLRRAAFDRGTDLRRVGDPIGGDVRDDTGRLVVILVFAGVFLGWCIFLLMASGLARAVRRGR
jgi:phosphoglucosamine mutase